MVPEKLVADRLCDNHVIEEVWENIDPADLQKSGECLVSLTMSNPLSSLSGPRESSASLRRGVQGSYGEYCRMNQDEQDSPVQKSMSLETGSRRGIGTPIPIPIPAASTHLALKGPATLIRSVFVLPFLAILESV